LRRRKKEELLTGEAKAVFNTFYNYRKDSLLSSSCCNGRGLKFSSFNNRPPSTFSFFLIDGKECEAYIWEGKSS